MKPPNKEQVEKLLEHINNYWDSLKAETKKQDKESGTLLNLPHPYLTPSHQGMFQEMYYWDCFFIALGLEETEYEEYIIYMTKNLAVLFDRFGIIPNGSRYYLTSRSQPPFFTKLMWLAYDLMKSQNRDDEAEKFLAEMTEIAEKEHHDVWMGTTEENERLVFIPDKSSPEIGLSRYFDVNHLHLLAGCESGWDHSTRCDELWLDHIAVDLNSILYVREIDIAEAKRTLGKNDSAAEWEERAKQRKKLINEYLWDSDRQFFFDYNYQKKTRNPHLSLAGFFPLWAGLAEPEQAEQIVSKWLPVFENQGGLVTSLEEKSNRQWAFPNGWAPLQWIVVEGLEKYGYDRDAMRIRHKWCQNCVTVYEEGLPINDENGAEVKKQALWERYNVVRVGQTAGEGCYGSAIAGFGWSNAIFKVFAKHPRFFESLES
ncbi:MAG: trehalase family glycosidase [Cyanobacteriota bacterium]|nr:trehalase family glycosidase [Cyanobacteriota bacterium]